MNTQFPRFYPSGNPQVDTEMRKAQALTILQVQKSRPTNTKSTYLPKQAEFRAWCDKKFGKDEGRYTVNGSVLHLFLRKEVKNIYICVCVSMY